MEQRAKNKDKTFNKTSNLKPQTSNLKHQTSIKKEQRAKNKEQRQYLPLGIKLIFKSKKI